MESFQTRHGRAGAHCPGSVGMPSYYLSEPITAAASWAGPVTRPVDLTLFREQALVRACDRAFRGSDDVRMSIPVPGVNSGSREWAESKCCNNVLREIGRGASHPDLSRYCPTSWFYGTYSSNCTPETTIASLEQTERRTSPTCPREIDSALYDLVELGRG